MTDEYNPAPRKWSLEEIDELLHDSGASVSSADDDAPRVSQPQKAESIDPRPTNLEKTRHFILPGSVEHSDFQKGKTHVFGSLESDKYRERFLNKPIQKLEKTAEHQIIDDKGTYERAGFVKKEGGFKNTAEFSPVPVLVTDDELIADEKKLAATRTVGLRSLAVTDGNAHDVEIPEEEEDMQLTFEGFSESEKIDQVDEHEVELELDRKRRKKAESFVITKEEEIDPADKPQVKLGIDEYRTVNDNFKVGYYLKKKTRRSFVNTAVLWAVFAFLTVIGTVASAVQTNGTLFITASLVLLLAAGAVSYELILNGVRSFKKFAFNKNAGAVTALAAGILQTVILYFGDSPIESGLHLYSAACVFPLALNMTAFWLENKRIKKNFEIISEKELYSIGNIEKKETAFEIGRGLLLDEPLVLSSQKTEFPRRFLEFSEKYYPSDEINRKSLPISCAAAAAVGLITLIISKSMLCGISSFAAVLSVCVPYTSFLADAFAIGSLSEKLNKKGSVIAGWEAFRECSSSNAMVADAADLYDSEGGNIFGVKTYYSMKIDEAILDTAALLIASGGPLGNLFKRVIMGKTALLPPVDTLAYEDKLGLSAWIRNRRVLVGSADLLKNHNVEVPERSTYEKHLHEGRYPLFLAIEGKVAALFIVSYDVNEQNAANIRRIEKNGISLLVKSDDANITDSSVSRDLSLPHSGVKVLSAISSDIFNSYSKEVTSASDALLMHNGKAATFFETVSRTLSLGKAKHLSGIIQIVSSGIGFAFAAVLSFISSSLQLSCIQLLITQLFFTAAAFAAVRIFADKR